MTTQIINLGNTLNDGGDSIRSSFNKVNENFIAVSNSFSNLLSYLDTFTATIANSSGTAASISYVNQLIITSTASIASSLQQLKTSFENEQTKTAGSYTNLIFLFSDSTTNIVSRIELLESSFTSTGTVSGASISYVDTAVANSTASLASSLQQLKTNFENEQIKTSGSYTNLITSISNSTGSVTTRISNLESSFSSLSTGTGATVSYVDTAVANSTASFASSIQTLTSNVNSLTNTVTVFASTIDGIQGRYGVTISGSAVTGFQLIGGSTTSEFIVNANNFKVKTNSGSLQPLSVSGDTVTLQNVVISGNFALGTTPAVSGSSMTGAGAALNATGTFALGNSTKNISFDGTTFTINGDLITTGNINTNAVTQIAGSSATGATGPTNGVSVDIAILTTTAVTPTTDGKVFINITLNITQSPYSSSGGIDPTITVYPQFFTLKRDDTTVVGPTFNALSWTVIDSPGDNLSHFYVLYMNYNTSAQVQGIVTYRAITVIGAKR